MSYVDGLLVSGETVLRREKQHWILPFYIAGKWVGLAAAVTVVAFLVNWILIPNGGSGILGGLAGLVSTLLAWITVVALLVALAGFVWSALRWQSQEYVLTDQRVIHVHGVLSKQSSDSVLESLTDAKIVVPFLGRMMGWGNLDLMTANESGNERMLALPDPVEFKKAVLEAKTARTVAISTAAYAASVAAAAGVPAAPPPPSAAMYPAPQPGPAPVAAPVSASAAPAPASPAAARLSGEELAQTLTALAGLRDSGAITADEFEAKKAELLARI